MARDPQKAWCVIRRPDGAYEAALVKVCWGWATSREAGWVLPASNKSTLIKADFPDKASATRFLIGVLEELSVTLSERADGCRKEAAKYADAANKHDAEKAATDAALEKARREVTP